VSSLEFTAIFVSIKLAAVTTLLLIAVCAPLAYFLARAAFPGKSFVDALVNLPMVLPPTVMGFYLVMMLGPKGAVGRLWGAMTDHSLLFTFPGIVLAAMICGMPYALQPMKAAFAKLDPRMLESAYVLGLSRIETFWRVVLPNSLSGLIAASVLVFLHTMGAFGVILMVGGSIAGETRVASVAIYEAVELMDYQTAGIMALCFVPVSYLFLLLVNKLNERTG